MMNMVELTFPFPATEAKGFVASQQTELSSNSWGDLIDELLHMRKFPDNWDGEGSPAPLTNLIDGATKLAQTLERRGVAPAQRVAASVNGTVIFEWFTPRGYCEIEVTAATDAELRWLPTGSSTATTTRFGISS